MALDGKCLSPAEGGEGNLYLLSYFRVTKINNISLNSSMVDESAKNENHIPLNSLTIHENSKNQ
jgi:hypothetical protein